MTAKHTPGPWNIWKLDCKTNSFYIRANKRPKEFVGQFPYTVAHIPRSTIAPMEANTRLIAAAPDLLEALRVAEKFVAQFEEEVDYVGGQADTINTIRAAIAKATGETP
jgi:hypothetical protein